jgi:hypothetical protein
MIAFFSKNFYLRAVSHQFFQALNFIEDVSARCWLQACFNARKHFYLNIV